MKKFFWRHDSYHLPSEWVDIYASDFYDAAEKVAQRHWEDDVWYDEKFTFQVAIRDESDTVKYFKVALELYFEINKK